MRILLPIAGETPFFPPHDYPFPKPLIEVAGAPMIERAVENLRELSSDARFVFVAMQDEAVRYSYDNIFRLITNGCCDTVLMRNRSRGALCSCLMAIDHIDYDAPLIIANYDQIVDVDMRAVAARFSASDADAGVLTFPATHPRWSYVVTDGDEVLEASEKRVISRQAIAGLYWFRRGAAFIDGAMATIRAADTVDGNYYVASCLNQIILAGARVVSQPIPACCLHSFYLPGQIDTYEREMELAAATRPSSEKPVNVVVPAAGEGSRFAKAGWGAPKPFIDVLGQPMLAHVQDNLAIENCTFTILVREPLVAQALGLFAARGDTKIEAVAALTEGTACTVLLARERIDGDGALLIANSDQIVGFSAQDFVDDARRRNLDGSILVFRDLARDPKWSFARTDSEGLVVEVAEKVAISDLATVGIYYFARGSEFVSAAIDMIVRNDRVNGEFYTCPVYNYMIRRGARIGVYEVPAGSMHGVGTPEDLDRYLKAVGGASARSAHAPAA